jgi:methionyl-tRNA formyltransferase
MKGFLSNMKIAFYLLGEKAYQSLEGFIDQYGTNNIGYIVVGKDKKIAKDFYEEMKQLANLYNIHTYERNDNIETKVNYSFSIGWRWLINSSNLIVFYDFLLPKYRGFSPLVNMLINGEKWLGVTALFAVDEYDKGAIIKQEKVFIEYPLKIQ